MLDLNDERVTTALEAHHKETAGVDDFLHHTERPIAQVDQIEHIGFLGNEEKAAVMTFTLCHLDFTDHRIF